ncbi:InlB B-repeat-containing protein, partial [Kitasatospora indigofera]|uniref:InlB B-repeat-containing protein n=1 Tax=Kitasatospora indigofera TaxID=67307 RepID=UPI0036A3FD3B
LEALLVGGGGAGAPTIQGYGPGGGGGGGAVKVVGFDSDPGAPVILTVGGPGGASTATQGAINAVASAGGGGSVSDSSFNGSGGMSGNGNLGAAMGGGGGAGSAGGAGSPLDGGTGVSPASVAPGSLFGTDTTCYGGGGATGDSGTSLGTAGCGGGTVTFTGGEVIPVAATPNSGGGGAGGGGSAVDPTVRYGAGGLIVLRWTVETVTVSFADNGHGGTVAPQTFVKGGTATPPTPSAAGYTFNGWFTDAALTTPVDFTAPVMAPATYYASWSAVAPVTVTVTFDTGGHGGPVAPQSFTSGGTVAEPTDPTASGFVFNGWFTDAALTTPVDFSAPVSASATYYASWSAVAPATVTVTFDNGGHGGSSAPQVIVAGGTIAP